ncbi:MAG: DsrE family protein, partial [Thermoleophilia bacterium]|nr:DsrE family protein [Thermoleophilia bacterium]
MGRNADQNYGPALSLVAFFHGDAGYMLLNDETYNAVRKTGTGNPYKGMVENLIKQGVQVEECAITMKANKWGNENLLPGVKVNSGALGRIVQLEQEGFQRPEPGIHISSLIDVAFRLRGRPNHCSLAAALNWPLSSQRISKHQLETQGLIGSTLSISQCMRHGTRNPTPMYSRKMGKWPFHTRYSRPTLPNWNHG